MSAGNVADDTAMSPTEVWLDAASAVAYLAELARPGLTVWDAVEEALRWWTNQRLAPPDKDPGDGLVELPWDDPDPLRTTIEQLFAAVPPAGATDGYALSDVLASALDHWVREMAIQHNDGHKFAHPPPVEGWPATVVE